jgi:glycosyltransferase involved in cell wall biosynthesis
VRILVATDQWFPDRLGGVARVASAIAAALAERGHLVDVLAPRTRGRRAHAEEGGVLVHRILPRGALPQTLSDAIATFAGARRHGRSYDVALAHVSPVACGLLAMRDRLPLVLAFHSSERQEIRFRRERSSGVARMKSFALQLPIALQERIATRRAARVLVLSEFTSRLLLAEEPSVATRTRRVSGGVDLDHFSPGDGLAAARARLGLSENGRPLLVTVRRLDPRMGLEQLVDGVDRLRGACEPRLAIVGDGPLRASLEQKVADLRLGDLVTLVGSVADDALPDWYRAADLFVLPTEAYEGFGLVTAEALSAGTPVVGTPVGATPELLAPLDPRLVMRSADAEGLAEGIRVGLGLADEVLRRRCTEYARERFDWSKSVVAWEQALEEAVAEATAA